MGSVIFIAMGASFLAVLFWYTGNENKEDGGALGLFAIHFDDDAFAAKGASYRRSDRASYAWRYDPMARMREDAAHAASFSKTGRASSNADQMARRRYKQQTTARAFKQL